MLHFLLDQLLDLLLGRDPLFGVHGGNFGRGEVHAAHDLAGGFLTHLLHLPCPVTCCSALRNFAEHILCLIVGTAITITKQGLEARIGTGCLGSAGLAGVTASIRAEEGRCADG